MTARSIDKRTTSYLLLNTMYVFLQFLHCFIIIKQRNNILQHSLS